MAFKFEDLKVWHRALDLSVEINVICTYFPSFELFNLSNQIRKAVNAVVINIAEGSTGKTNPEFIKFLEYSLRLAIEVVSGLFIAKKKTYISDDVFKKKVH